MVPKCPCLKRNTMINRFDQFYCSLVQLRGRLASDCTEFRPIVRETTAATDCSMGVGSNGSGLYQDAKGRDRRKCFMKNFA